MCSIVLFSCYSTLKSKVLSVTSTVEDLKMLQWELENFENLFEKEIEAKNFYPVLWTFKEASASIGRSLDTFQDDVKLWIKEYDRENLPWLVDVHKSQRIEPVAFRKWFQKKRSAGRPKNPPIAA